MWEFCMSYSSMLCEIVRLKPAFELLTSDSWTHSRGDRIYICYHVIVMVNVKISWPIMSVLIELFRAVVSRIESIQIWISVVCYLLTSYSLPEDSIKVMTTVVLWLIGCVAGFIKSFFVALTWHCWMSRCSMFFPRI